MIFLRTWFIWPWWNFIRFDSFLVYEIFMHLIHSASYDNFLLAIHFLSIDNLWYVIHSWYIEFSGILIHFSTMIIQMIWFIFTHWYFMLNDSFDYCEILSHYDSFLLSVILLKIDSFSWVEILVPQIHFRGLKFCGWWFICTYWNFAHFDSFYKCEILFDMIHS